MLAWALNWLFFDIDNKHAEHALTRNFGYSKTSQMKFAKYLAVGYNFAMNFVVTGLTLAGAALPRIVVAADSINSNVDELTDEFAAISTNPVQQYLYWYFGCGLSVGTLAMGISFLNPPTKRSLDSRYLGVLQLLHKPEKVTPRIKRTWRVGCRFIICTSWTLLPLAASALSSLNFLSIITGSCYLCLFIEVYGQSPKGSMIFDWKDDWDDGYREVHGGDHRMIRTVYGFF